MNRRNRLTALLLAPLGALITRLRGRTLESEVRSACPDPASARAAPTGGESIEERNRQLEKYTRISKYYIRLSNKRDIRTSVVISGELPPPGIDVYLVMGKDLAQVRRYHHGNWTTLGNTPATQIGPK